MGQTIEECRKNYSEKRYHLQCLIPSNIGTSEYPNIVYRKWIRWSGYRTGRQSLDAIRDLRNHDMKSWGKPWLLRIKIVS